MLYSTRDYSFITRHRVPRDARRRLQLRRALARLLGTAAGVGLIFSLGVAVSGVVLASYAPGVNSTHVSMILGGAVAALPFGLLHLRAHTVWMPDAWRSISRGVFRPSALEWRARSRQGLSKDK